VPADVQDELMSGVDHLVESLARWYLMEMPGADLGPTIEAARPAFDRLQAALAAAGSEARRQERDEIERRLFSQGVPPELARAHALGPELRQAPDIIAVANETGRPVEEVAEAFVAVSEGLGIGRCDRAVADLPVAERAERWARQALRDDVMHARRDLARRALTEAGGDPHAAVEAFLAARPHGRRRLELFVQPLGGAGGTELASVTLAVRELRALAES
jgi:glutamate dehydrogenase